jgi:ribosomal-protein-alanine N-acetyltransferase
MDNSMSFLRINKTEPPFLLRQMSADDAETLFQINQTEGVLRYFPNQAPPPIEAVRRFITRQQAHWEKYGYGNWAVVPEGHQAMAGWAGLQYLPELDETEVGFLLDRPFWGHGYATAAALESLRFGFDQCGLKRIIALVHPENLASRRVIEKCGMAYEETMALWGVELMRFGRSAQG